MLSRVANSLFWMARYLERAENTARFLTVTHGYAQELRGVVHGAADQCWEVAAQVLDAEDASPGLPSRTFRRYAFDEDLPSSVIAAIIRARENARGIRDAISSEMWEELNVLHMRLHEEAKSSPEGGELSMLQRVRNASHLFQGLRDNTMVRGDEWHFLMLGQFIERADWTARVLEAMWSHPALYSAAESGHSIDTMHLVATLRACTAFEAFARAERTVVAERAVAFLLLEARFSRSVEFCIQEVVHSLHALSGTPQDVFSNDAEQLAGRLVAELRFASIDEIMGQGLPEYLQVLLGKIGQVSALVGQQYFR